MRSEKEAQQFIRKHIGRRGELPIVVTEKKIKWWWQLINVAVFRNELAKPLHIVISTCKNEWAWVSHCEIKGRIDLKICPTYSSRKLFLTVLVHEMVHAYECQNHTRMGHGKRFFSWKKRIDQTIGLTLEQVIDEHLLEK